MEIIRSRRLEIRARHLEQAQNLLLQAGYAVKTSDSTLFLYEARALDAPVRFELVNVTTQSVARGEIIELTFATHVHLEGAHALILKDICHSGVTENYLLTHLAQQRPVSREVAALINKPKLRRVAIEPRYVVLDDAPEGRLVGYGGVRGDGIFRRAHRGMRRRPAPPHGAT
jgi:hypoxanthine-guanine phosphoribosyltransferase